MPWRAERDEYAFDGTFGQQIYFDSLTTNNAIGVQLLSPGGVSLFDRHTNVNLGPFTLSETGSYRLVFDMSSPNLVGGPYSFRVLDVAAAPLISLDQHVKGEINPSLQTISTAWKLSWASACF